MDLVMVTELAGAAQLVTVNASVMMAGMPGSIAKTAPKTTMVLIAPPVLRPRTDGSAMVKALVLAAPLILSAVRATQVMRVLHVNMR